MGASELSGGLSILVPVFRAGFAVERQLLGGEEAAKGLAFQLGNPESSRPCKHGWVPERSNGLAWKACVPHKGTEGSNPSPSARSLKEVCRFEVGVTNLIR